MHNILEPATFGIPVIIGDKYNKFQEAIDLVKIGGCISIKNQQELNKSLINFNKDEEDRDLTGLLNKKYIQENLGATKQIMNYLKDKI